MRLFSRWLLCLPLALAVACEPPATQQETPTAVDPATTREADTAFEAVVEFGGIRFVNTLPGTVADGQIVDATSPDPTLPAGEAVPDHILFEFQPYFPEAFQEAPGITPPQIAVFSRDQFAEYGFDQEAAALETLLANRSDPNAQDSLPYLPAIAGDQLFHAAAIYLEFDGGVGIRYITAFGLDVAPLRPEQVFYTFQGLTEDGRYISATFPIVTGLIPIPDTLEGPEYDAFAARYPEYLAEIRDRIEAADPETGFTPSLTQLDALLQSIQVN